MQRGTDRQIDSHDQYTFRLDHGSLSAQKPQQAMHHLFANIQNKLMQHVIKCDLHQLAAGKIEVMT